MDKCEVCEKHKSVFKNIDTNEKLCFLCGIKMQYKLEGIKGVLNTIKFHLKSKWILSWQDKFVNLIIYIILISLTATSISCLVYVIVTGQHWLILNSIISLVAVIMLWKN